MWSEKDFRALIPSFFLQLLRRDERGSLHFIVSAVKGYLIIFLRVDVTKPDAIFKGQDFYNILPRTGSSFKNHPSSIWYRSASAFYQKEGETLEQERVKVRK